MLVEKLRRVGALAEKLAAAANGKLAEANIARCRQADIARAEFLRCVKLKVVPLEQSNIVLLKAAGVGETIAVVRQLKAVASCVQTGIEHYAVDIAYLTKIDCYALAAAKIVERLRRVGIAEADKCRHGVERGYYSERYRVAPAEGAFRRIFYHRRGRGRAAKEEKPYEKQDKYRKNVCQLHVEPPIQIIVNYIKLYAACPPCAAGVLKNSYIFCSCLT